MGKYIGPKCKLCRREMFDLGFKTKAIDKKCNMKSTPGESKSKIRSLISGYNAQLREKQKIRRVYGLRERQFRNLYKKSAAKKGNTGIIFLQYLESRLDNVVYRMGFSQTRAQARQFVSHRFILLNDKVCNISSCILKNGDKLSLVPKAQKMHVIIDSIVRSKSLKGFPWLDVDYDQFAGVFYDVPENTSSILPFNEQLVVELYSKL